MRRTCRQSVDSTTFLRTYRLRFEELESRSMLAADSVDAVDDAAFFDAWQEGDGALFDEAAYAGFESIDIDSQWLMPPDPVDVRMQFVVSDESWATYSYSIGFDGSVLGVSVMASYDEPTVAAFVAAHADDGDAQIYDFGGGWSIDNFPIDLAPPVPGAETPWAGSEEVTAFVSQPEDAWVADTTGFGGDWGSQDAVTGFEDVAAVDVPEDPLVNVADVATPLDDGSEESVVDVSGDEPTIPSDGDASQAANSGWDESTSDETPVGTTGPCDDGGDPPSAVSGDGFQQIDVGDASDRQLWDVGDVSLDETARDGVVPAAAQTFTDVVVAGEAAGAVDQTSPSSPVAPRATAFADMRILFAMATMMSSGGPESSAPVGVGRRRR